MSKTILEVTKLGKVYGQTVAVDRLSFAVGVNEIVGLLGPNGAGKTTTISMILGILRPTHGSIRVNGRDIQTHRQEVLSKMSFAAVYAPLPGNITVYQNLRVFAYLYGVKNAATRIAEVMRWLEIDRYRNTKCGVLSSGEQTRLSLAKALLNDPDLLLLDEPTASLDPSVAVSIRATLRSFARERGSAVLWTSHNMHEVTAVCDSVLFLSRGKVVLSGNPKTLPERYGKRNLEELFIAVAQQRINGGETL